MLPSKLILLLASLLILSITACGSDPQPILKVGGIPDQDTSRLARRYQIFADYLAKELDVEVEYVPSADYAAVVTAFGQGDLHLAFFGALTGVQARLQNPGAQAIVQRVHDAEFNSKLVARPDLNLDSLEASQGPGRRPDHHLWQRKLYLRPPDAPLLPHRGGY